MKDKERIEKGLAILRLVNKSTGQNEAVFQYGGAVISDEIIPDILSPNFAEDTLYADCKIYNTKKGRVKIPIVKETVRQATNIKGGIRAYVVGEGVEKSNTYGQFATLDLSLNKEAVVIYCTDELLQDSEAIATYINEAAEEALIIMLDYGIVYGGGLISNPIAAHACTGHVALSNPITLAELHDFYDKYYGGKKAKWYISKSRWTQVLDLFEADITGGDGGGSVFLTFADGVWYLFGYPVIVCDWMEDNDILLADLSQFVIAQSSIKKDVNESLKWLEDEKAFRFVLRLNGGSSWETKRTLKDGSEVHPFVISTGMEQSSSSSSSSSYVENYSSSSSSQSLFSSSSSSYIELHSSSSSSSVSSASSASSMSSESSHSSSSSSISSASSESSESSSYSSESSESSNSSSYSSESSESSNSSSDSSESSLSSESVGNVSSSSSSNEGCGQRYLGEYFDTAALNGNYDYDGAYDGAASYSNGTYYLWLDSVSGYWVISNTKGDPQNQWKSSIDTVQTCPDGDDWVSEDGRMTLVL